MMDDTRLLQHCEFSLKMSTITRRSYPDRKKLASRRMQNVEQKLLDSNVSIETQMIVPRECSSYSNECANFKPSPCCSKVKDCSLLCAEVDSFCDPAIHIRKGRVKKASGVVEFRSTYLFTFLILSFCANAGAQFYSQSYLNSMSSGVGSRFKNFVGNANLKISMLFNQSEDAPVGTQVGTVRGNYDNDSPNTIHYRINRTSDPKRQFSVDPNGSIKVAQLLDREEIPYYHLIVEAFDEGGNGDSLGMDVMLTDVNDNAPIPYTVPNPCIFWENVEPQNQQPCEIRAIDRDTIENGPPFTMEVAASFLNSKYVSYAFDQAGDNGNGSMIIRPLIRFDREADIPGKFLEIPLILYDKYRMRSDASVYIIIGDQNDNNMTDGTANIQVYSYLGQMERTMIGRVYVEDKDDWDLPDKTFTWSSAGPVDGFSLAPNGEITMNANMPPGRYTLVSAVSDNVRNERATGTVYVDVITVPQASFDNQAVLRILHGSPYGYFSPDVFLKTDSQGSSPMTRFVNKMTEYLGSDVNIQIFSIQPGEVNLQTMALKVIDVRFSAYGTSYLDPVALNGLISQRRAELETVIGATIVAAGIDMCKFTLCDHGCQTVHSANESGYVVSANQTVIVGVTAWSNDSCVCPVFEAPNACRTGLCKNGGICHNTSPNGFFCECRDTALKGFRCQGTTRSFNGAGFAWFKPVPACTSLNISFQFMTTKPDGLLLYNGPMGDNITFGHVDYRDYMTVRLVSGRVEAELSFNGDMKTTVTVSGSGVLSDGKWHTISLVQNRSQIELVLDNCAPGDDIPIGTNSLCRQVRTADDDERLNVITPLQVGGLANLTGTDRYPSAITSQVQTYDGCIRDLVVNGEQYDLGHPVFADDKNSQIGCSLNEVICRMNDVNGEYCQHGECVADATSVVPKCNCDPGYSGNQCDQKIEWVEFSGNSFIDYNVAVFLETKKSDIDVLVYPGSVNSGSGSLVHATDGGSKYTGTYLTRSMPGAHFDCGNGTSDTAVDLKLNNVQLLNNYSYWIQFSRNPTRASLSVDGIYYTAMQLSPEKRPYEINIKQLLLGAEGINGANSFQGCIGTFRWDHQNFPLYQTGNESTVSQTMTSSAEMISIRQSRGVTRGCSARATCAALPSFCSGQYVCADFWKGPFCTCPSHLNPLLGPDGTLVGCGSVLAISKLGITNNAIIIIMVFLGLLLLMVLLMIVYSRRQAPPFAPVRPVELNRDNIRPYDIEGGGEADNDQYDLNGLKKPVMPLEGNGLGGFAPPAFPAQRKAPDEKIDTIIKNLEDPDVTAPYDELHIFEDERDNVSRLSLDSLESADEGTQPSNLDQQEIRKWGPRFEVLADIYGKRE